MVVPTRLSTCLLNVVIHVKYTLLVHFSEIVYVNVFILRRLSRRWLLRLPLRVKLFLLRLLLGRRDLPLFYNCLQLLVRKRGL